MLRAGSSPPDADAGTRSRSPGPRPARAANAPPEMGPTPAARETCRRLVSEAARAAAPDRRALDPTRSGPVRSATTPHPTARATPAARPGPLHPTRRTTAARESPSAGPGHASRQHTVSIRGIEPRAAEARGYADVEDSPMPLYAMLATCAALTLVVMSLAVPREVDARRRTRLRAAQEKWARELDRRW